MPAIPGLHKLLDNVPELRTAPGVLRLVASLFGVMLVVVLSLAWVAAQSPFLALLLQIAFYVLNYFLLRSFFRGREERLDYTEAFFNRFAIAAGVNVGSVLFVGLSGGTYERLVPAWIGWLLALYLLASAVLLAVRALATAGVDTVSGMYVYYPDEGRQMTDSVYDVIRHPLYAALDRLALALALVNGTAYALLLGLLFVAVWHPAWYGLEERELVARFGDTYRQYRDRVPAVMPDSLAAELRLWEALRRRPAATE